MSVSVGAAAERPKASRVVVDPGAGIPSFAARLQQARTAWAAAAGTLPAAGQAAADTLLEDVCTRLWPDPAAEPQALPWALWIGASRPAGRGPHGLKLYARATSRSALRDLNLRVPDDAEVEPRFVGWNVAGNGEVSAKVYVAPRRGAEHRSVAYLADRAGIDSREVLAALRAAALERALWRNDVVLCTGSEPAPGLLAVHAAPPPDADRLELARAVLDRYAGGATVLDDMVVRTATTGLAWLVSGIGISFAPPGEVEHVNVYLAPS